MSKVVSNIQAYKKRANQAADNALRKMAGDIEKLAKVQNVPVDTGQLAASINFIKMKNLSYRVEADKEYARFQEFGGDKKRQVKNYSKPGTGPHYMKRSTDTIVSKKDKYLKNKIELVYVPGDGKVIWRSK